jgi:hypothetical protein
VAVTWRRLWSLSSVVAEGLPTVCGACSIDICIYIILYVYGIGRNRTWVDNYMCTYIGVALFCTLQGMDKNNRRKVIK